jgi:hypothetical protein
MQLPWPGRGSAPADGVLPTKNIPTISGPSFDFQDGEKPTTRPRHVRTTSSAARVSSLLESP